MWINAFYLGITFLLLKEIKTIWFYDDSLQNVTLLSTILQYAKIIEINPSLLHLQETIVKKFHHRRPHQNQNQNNKNRDRNRMYVSIFLYYH